MTAPEYNPPHGGYPNPSYNEAPMRRRIESMLIYGHPGAHVSLATKIALERAAVGKLDLHLDRPNVNEYQSR